MYIKTYAIGGGIYAVYNLDFYYYLNETIDLCVGVAIVCQFYAVIQLL